MSRNGKCQCEALTVTCEGEPQIVFECHCHACQQRTGSIMAVIGYSPNEGVTRQGKSSEYIRIGDGGSKITHYFCPNCGTTVYYEAPEVLPGLTAVDVGCFNDSEFPSPTMSVYGKRRYHWVSQIEGIPNLDGPPDL